MYLIYGLAYLQGGSITMDPSSEAPGVVSNNNNEENLDGENNEMSRNSHSRYAIYSIYIICTVTQRYAWDQIKIYVCVNSF